MKIEQMKKIFFITSTLIVSFFTITFYFTSCQPDPCITRHIECQNGGTCKSKSGYCICASGYEGDSCQFLVNKKFNGTYKGVVAMLIDNTTNFNNDDTLILLADSILKYKVSISSVRTPTLIQTANALANTLTINYQLLAGFEYSGVGSLNNDTVLTLSVKADSVVNGIVAKTITYTFVGFKYE